MRKYDIYHPILRNKLEKNLGIRETMFVWCYVVRKWKKHQIV